VRHHQKVQPQVAGKPLQKKGACWPWKDNPHWLGIGGATIIEEMKTWLAAIHDRLRTSFWFMPTMMALAAAGLAALSLVADWKLNESALPLPAWIHPDAEGARALLSTIVGSIITVLSVVFSITIVSLTLAETEYGPRLLPNFMRDRGTKLVLGTFCANFLFCIIVFQSVTGGEIQFVPRLSVGLAVLLTIFSLGMLIYFVHHVAEIIQASSVIARASGDLHASIQRTFPQTPSHGNVEETATIAKESDPARSTQGRSILRQLKRESQPVPSIRDGYLTDIQEATLLAKAEQYDIAIEVVRKPGDFIVEGQALAQLAPLPHEDGEEVIASVRRCFLFSHRRSDRQDPISAVQHLVDVALRALSPSLNDPFTAVSCIHWLGAAIAKAARRSAAEHFRYDGKGRLRLVVEPPAFQALLSVAFDPIRQAAGTQTVVSDQLLETLGRIGALACDPRQRTALRKQAEQTYREAMRVVVDPDDRAALRHTYEQTCERLADEQTPAGQESN
jgi:uncharacterized membrane protein